LGHIIDKSKEEKEAIVSSILAQQESTLEVEIIKEDILAKRSRGRENNKFEEQNF
jgi:hypothetical protein